jgi:lysozyme family protein
MGIGLFTNCVEAVLRSEGGYCNVPGDKGGETNMGITRTYYPNLDIKNLTRNQAIEIYYRDYWLPMNLTGIADEELVLQIFDFGVNAGIRRSIKAIQKIVKVDVDGIVGPQTTEAINKSDLSLVLLFKQSRKMYYFDLVRRDPTQEKFLQGWINRIDQCHF